MAAQDPGLNAHMVMGVEIVYSLTNVDDFIKMQVGSWVIYNRTLDDTEYDDAVEYMMKQFVEPGEAPVPGLASAQTVTELASAARCAWRDPDRGNDECYGIASGVSCVPTCATKLLTINATLTCLNGQFTTQEPVCARKPSVAHLVS